jgi:hypothetical protein
MKSPSIDQSVYVCPHYLFSWVVKKIDSAIVGIAFFNESGGSSAFIETHIIPSVDRVSNQMMDIIMDSKALC